MTDTMSDSVRVPRFTDEQVEAGAKALCFASPLILDGFSPSHYSDEIRATWRERSMKIARAVLEAAAPAPAADVTTLPGYPFLPCPICKGVEGCDHTVPERARAADVREAALVEAIKPFAEFAEHVSAEHPGWFHDDFVLDRSLTEMCGFPKMGAFIAAFAALASRPAMDADNG